MMTEHLASSLFDADPPGRLLVRKLKVNSRLRALLLAIGLAVLTSIVVPWLDGFLIPRPGIVSSLQDLPSLLIALIAIPAIYSYYCFEQPDMIRELFQGFVDSDTLIIEEGQYQEFLRKLQKRLAWRGWSIVALMLTAAAVVLHASAVLSSPEPSAYYPNPAIFFGLNLPLMTLPIYMVWMMLLRHLTVIVDLFRLFRSHKTQVHALHPDGCGGLSFIGRFSLRGSYFIAILALNISLLTVINLRQQRNPLTEPSMTLAAAAYLVLAPIAFFLPLTPAHRGMREAKRSAQRLISNEANRIYREIQNNLQQGAVDQTAIGRCGELTKLYDLTKNFPG